MTELMIDAPDDIRVVSSSELLDETIAGPDSLIGLEHFRATTRIHGIKDAIGTSALKIISGRSGMIYNERHYSDLVLEPDCVNRPIADIPMHFRVPHRDRYNYGVESQYFAERLVGHIEGVLSGRIGKSRGMMLDLLVDEIKSRI